MHSGSCNCRPSLEASWLGFSERSFLKVVRRKRVDQSASGELIRDSDVVCFVYSD